jgi:threonine/homoserine/homoserine lactone efflux protein
MIGSLAGAVGVLGLLTIAPGPDMAVVTRAAVAEGRRAAAETAGGVVCGLLVWGLLAVGGLAAVLAASADAYTGVRLVGAAYLVWLGLWTLSGSREASGRSRSRGVRSPWSGSRRPGIDAAGEPVAGGGRRLGGAWRRGFVTNLVNPKIGVFYTSVLPALVPSGAPTAATQAGLVLGHAGLSLVWLNGWARAIGRSRSVLRRPRVGVWVERVSGAVLVGLGVEITAGTA